MKVKTLMRNLFLTCFLILIISACITETEMPSVSTIIPAEAIPTIDPTDTRLSTAQFNYNRNCAHCHGYGGEGQHPNTIERTVNLGYHLVPAHDASGHTWQHPDQLLFDTIKYGVQAQTNFYVMTSFSEQLNDDEIFAVIDYMSLWWTDEQRDWQDQLSEQFSENNPSWTPNRFDEESE